MYICNKCHKSFPTPSKLNIHNNRKTPCNISKQTLECKCCNIKFKCSYDQTRHEKTKKHKFNIENNTFNAESIHIGDNINIQNIINLTLNTNTFSNSNVELVANQSIELVYGIFDDIINNKNIMDCNRTLQLFKEAVIFILDTLHFNISKYENQNLKILLMFPKIDNLIYEYLILEINKNTNELVWNSINYKQLIEEILNLLTNINNKHIEKHKNIKSDKNIMFDKFINFLKINLIEDTNNKDLLKPEIEKMLSELYIKFNKNQKKQDRTVEINILDKIQEYRNYRNQECILSNGYTPSIINSQI
jgi:hypothetical protein